MIKILLRIFYKAETTNVFWKYVKADLISKNNAVSSINLSHQLIDEYSDIASFIIECLSEDIRLNHSTYDMLYLVLAKRSGGLLLTLDKRLRETAVKEGIETPEFC